MSTELRQKPGKGRKCTKFDVVWIEDGTAVELVGSMMGSERRDAKTCFSAARPVYVYHFKDVRQGALQTDSVFRRGACAARGYCL